mmetsp:Transcript_2492/g.5968  ORF Transcript_2492/g.5968 Transcript_2492/m.5968 type:complete len:236 (-) Transcript_2492:2457-3164(-)
MVVHEKRPSSKATVVEEEHGEQRKSLANTSRQGGFTLTTCVGIKSRMIKILHFLLSRKCSDGSQASDRLARYCCGSLIGSRQVPPRARDELHLQHIRNHHQRKRRETDQRQHPSSDESDRQRDRHDDDILNHETDGGSDRVLNQGRVFCKLSREAAACVLRVVEEGHVLSEHGSEGHLSQPLREMLAHHAEGEELEEVGDESSHSQPDEAVAVLDDTGLHHVEAHARLAVEAIVV